ncbi:MAG: 4Fe-4S dicluster domain-containing protein [Magnetococcales bacterium]|nr:4Fe-4S dicluster domain-containing protein [Magnetococcales bacterium]
MDQLDHISIQYDGEPYTVPSGRTILTALEEIGLRFVRGIGCRGGVCGACTVFYRVDGEPELHAGLMCQDPVIDGMDIMPLPAFPQKKARYDLELPEGDTADYRVVALYPEVNRCIMCSECVRVCPMGLDVMGYVGMIKRGDLRHAAEASFTCIQCQACALRCPAQISQPNAALAARRFYGRHQAPQAEHLTKSVERTQDEKFQRNMERLRRVDMDALRILYQRQEREPGDAPPGTWLPEDRSML